MKGLTEVEPFPDREYKGAPFAAKSEEALIENIRRFSETLTDMEKERKPTCTHLLVTCW